MLNNTPEIDLFEHYETLPQPVQDILLEWGECGTYERCERLLKALAPHGYTFEYYLDGEPYDLKLIN